MRYTSLKDFLKSHHARKAADPLAMIFIEDDVEIDTTARHHQKAGFKTILMFMPSRFDLAPDVDASVIRVDHDLTKDASLTDVVNDVIDTVPEKSWVYYCYNAEYLFHPFCETRTVGEMLTFHGVERRSAMLTYVVDLYAEDLNASPDAVSLKNAHLDRSGYYALARKTPEGHPKERQLDFFGGLRWRYEEHVPANRRKIDRISLFQTEPGLKLREDFTFNKEELNTFACPWHHNITAAVCSFRTAKALKRNPGSTFDIETFKWHNSAPFEWHSRQLLDLGLMEPGQWF
ncbi:MAG: glycosyltransferase family 2 protein [Paracoccaceae bacterium]